MWASHTRFPSVTVFWILWFSILNGLVIIGLALSEQLRTALCEGGK
ncbi:MAG: hypothetical protein ABI162_09490 [Luteolibacter sp.]